MITVTCTKRSSYAHFICTSMIFILRTPNKPTTSASVVYLVNIRCHAWISLARPSRMPRATVDGVATNSTAEPSDFACWHPTDDMCLATCVNTCIDYFAMRSARPLEVLERVPSCFGRVNRLSWPMEGVRWSGHCRRADCEQHPFTHPFNAQESRWTAPTRYQRCNGTRPLSPRKATDPWPLPHWIWGPRGVLWRLPTATIAKSATKKSIASQRPTTDSVCRRGTVGAPYDFPDGSKS